MMGPQELEPLVADLHGGQEVAEIDPAVGIHLETVPLGEVAEYPGHGPSKGLDLLVVQEELALVPAERAHLGPVVPMRTALLQHRVSPPEWLGIGQRVMNLCPPRGRGPPPGPRAGRVSRV